MPIYEYECRECGYQFEQTRHFRERYDPLECPRCGSVQTEKLVSNFDFALVGSGWAATGYDKGDDKKGKK